MLVHGRSVRVLWTLPDWTDGQEKSISGFSRLCRTPSCARGRCEAALRGSKAEPGIGEKTILRDELFQCALVSHSNKRKKPIQSACRLTTDLPLVVLVSQQCPTPPASACLNAAVILCACNAPWHDAASLCFRSCCGGPGQHTLAHTAI